MNTDKFPNQTREVNLLLIKIREKANLSKNEFAILITASSPSIARMENLTKEPFLRSIMIISLLTDWSMDYITHNKEIYPNDGDFNFFLETVAQYRKSKNINTAYKYASQHSTTKNVNTEEASTSKNKSFKQLQKDNLELSDKISKLLTEISYQKMTIARSDKTISILENQNNMLNKLLIKNNLI
jgi:DNA-binding XRE family transcriptional regulator